MAKFFGNWSSTKDVLDDFMDPRALDGAELLIAAYETGNYEGSSFVLYRKDGKLFEVNASHCSCYGLEQQWEPEEVDTASLRHRAERGFYLLGEEVADAVLAAI